MDKRLGYVLTLALFTCLAGIASVSFGNKIRIYRIAIAATGEFTDHHGGTKADARAAIKAILAEVNSVYEKELAVRLELIPDAELNKIIYTDGTTDPYTAGNRSAQLLENQTTIDAEIGSANYDIGHVFGMTSGGGGGLASLGAVGHPTRKARGVSETGDPSASNRGFVSVVLHEIGHQFGAEHTFNADGPGTDFCEGNRASGNAYEPGSGSTLMSYAGICEASDLQDDPDWYFHSKSVEQMENYMASNAHAAPFNAPDTGNSVPSVDAGADYTIPANTPFALTANGTDPDGDPLTYVWEQIDLGPAMSLPLSDNGSSPLFRSWPPAASPTRTFPRLTDLLQNTTDPGERLPTTNRTLTFRATVRDNRSGGGGMACDDVALTVVQTGNAFAVTSPNGGESWTGGATQTIMWDVAGTTAYGVNVSEVALSFSADGGLTFPFLLATTANDGSAVVTLPNIDTAQARIRVSAVGNVFFDVSDSEFTVSSDMAVPGIAVAATDGDTVVAEDGVLDAYTIAAYTPPNAPVTVAISGNEQVEVSTDGVSFSQSAAVNLTDTNSETIYVRAVDDLVLEGGHLSVLQHVVSSSSDASYPAGMLINTLPVMIEDNDAPPLVGIDFDFDDVSYESPEHWLTAWLTSSSASYQNLTRDDGVATAIDLDLSYASGSPGRGSAGAEAVTKPVHVPELEEIDGYSRGGASLTATWSDLVPGQRYGVYVFGLDTSEAQAYGQEVAITGETTLAPFTQTLTDNQLHVNASIGSDGQLLEEYEKQVAADEQGRIQVQIEPLLDGYSLAGLALRAIRESVPGLTLTSTELVEGGAASSYDWVLNTAPNGSVTIVIDADADSEVSLDGASFASSQTVSVSNQLPQRLFVRAIDDSQPESSHTTTLQHTILASTSADYPVTLALPDLTLKISDNDAFAPLIGVDFDEDPNTPTNWNQIASWSGTTWTDLDLENGSSSAVDLTIRRSNVSWALGPTDPRPETVPSHSPDISEVGFVFLHRSNAVPIEVTWSDLVPSTRYHLYVFALENFGGISIDQTVTIQGAGIDDPAPFTQVSAIGRQLIVNDQVGSDQLPLEAYAIPVTATATGEIDLTIQASAAVADALLGGLAIQEAPILNDIVLDQGDGVAIAEAGGTDTYTLALASLPAGTVTVSILADAQSEVSLDGASFAEMQTINLTDTSAQTIHVRAVDDAAAEGTHTSRITHEVTTTGDAAVFPIGAFIPTLTAPITDNDARISLAITDATAAEPADDGAFTVSLPSGETAPAGGVTVTYSVEGTASNGSDYDSLSGMVVIPAGGSTAVLPVQVINDAEEELPESIVVTLTGSDHPSLGIASPPHHQATIYLTSDEMSGYQTWVANHYAWQVLTDPSQEATVWGAHANSDGDVLVNVEEYFYGTSLAVYDPDHPIAVEIIEDGGVLFLELIFARRKSVSGIDVVIEQGNRPDDWMPASGTSESSEEIDSETDDVRVRWPIGTDFRHFLRIRLTESGP